MLGQEPCLLGSGPTFRRAQYELVRRREQEGVVERRKNVLHGEGELPSGRIRASEHIDST